MIDRVERDVLVVDDDEAIRNLLCLSLARKRLAVDAACDGIDALQRISMARYAVILLDLMMPRLDGIGLLRALDSHPVVHTDRPLVMVMTAGGDIDHLTPHAERVHAMIRKPFDLPQFADIVGRCVTDLADHSSVAGAM